MCLTPENLRETDAVQGARASVRISLATLPSLRRPRVKRQIGVAQVLVEVLLRASVVRLVSMSKSDVT